MADQEMSLADFIQIEELPLDPELAQDEYLSILKSQEQHDQEDSLTNNNKYIFASTNIEVEVGKRRSQRI